MHPGAAPLAAPSGDDDRAAGKGLPALPPDSGALPDAPLEGRAATDRTSRNGVAVEIGLVGQPLDFLHRHPYAGLGKRRQFLAKTEILARNRERPGSWASPKQVPCERQDRAGIGHVTESLKAVRRLGFLEFNAVPRAGGGIDENHGCGMGYDFRQLRSQLVADEDKHSGEVERGDRLGDSGPGGVIAAQGVAEADDQESVRGRHAGLNGGFVGALRSPVCPSVG